MKIYQPPFCSRLQYEANYCNRIISPQDAKMYRFMMSVVGASWEALCMPANVRRIGGKSAADLTLMDSDFNVLLTNEGEFTDEGLWIPSSHDPLIIRDEDVPDHYCDEGYFIEYTEPGIEGGVLDALATVMAGRGGVAKVPELTGMG